MKQIYNFEAKNPPVLTEAALIDELERRKNKRLPVVFIVAGIFIQLVMGILGVMAVEFYPAITNACFGYILASIAGSGIMASVYVKREERVICGEH